MQLSFESHVIDNREPPTNHPSLIQEMIDLGLVKTQRSRAHCDLSRFQRECWFEYCSDLVLPSIYTWELWHEKFITSQKESTTLIAPGEDFEHFNYVWVQEMEIQTVQPG
ncbi:hypothetical protein [Acaryochloris marina]|uniref:hypothetical protein n=1 Tax=Acaryochloris marina TaxID=155978 RepID=UPI001BB01D6B|nr:hypothetical protein [Acaryochloris marina]QUY44760.1 hypothetical protein I1H34_12110 [Acaryochloris marina S15]